MENDTQEEYKFLTGAQIINTDETWDETIDKI